MAPALAFYFAFTSAARLNRQNQIELLILAIGLVIIGVCANMLSIFLIDAWPGLDPFVWIIARTGDGATRLAYLQPSQLAEAFRSYALNLAIASLVAGIFGFALSKLIVWGVIDAPVYHGPMYPIIRGVIRKYVVAVVVTRLEIERKRYVVYSGNLDHIVISSSHAISLVALANPTKSLFSARRNTPRAGASRIIYGFPPGVALANTQVTAERLLIEGEDIQNIYFVRSSAGPKQPFKTFVLKQLSRCRPSPQPAPERN